MDTHIWDELDLLSAKLARAETAHQRALSVGDADDTYRARIQLAAVMAERDRLIGKLSAGISGE
jgi:hypothetical protein